MDALRSALQEEAKRATSLVEEQKGALKTAVGALNEVSSNETVRACSCATVISVLRPPQKIKPRTTHASQRWKVFVLTQCI